MSYHKIYLRACTKKEDLDAIEALYNEAFPECERKPFEVMTAAIGRGLDMCALEENGKFVGLAITLMYGGVALLDYFAILPHFRGNGIGSSALRAIKENYPGYTVLIEIEDPSAECDNREIRMRRQRFYLRCGMVRMPYKVNFYGTEMLVLTSGGRVSFDEHVAVYKNILGEAVARNISLIEE